MTFPGNSGLQCIRKAPFSMVTPNTELLIRNPMDCQYVENHSKAYIVSGVNGLIRNRVEMVPAMGIQNYIQKSYISFRTFNLRPVLTSVNRSDRGDCEMILALKFAFRLRRKKLRPRGNSLTCNRRFQLFFSNFVHEHVRENKSVYQLEKAPLNSINVAKFESDLLKSNGDKASQSRAKF